MAVATIAGALLGSTALGAQVPTRDSTARRIEPIVVRGARTPAVTGGASSVTVRPDSLPIPTLPAPTLEQVLRQTPFVLIRQNSRGEAELSVRGSDSRQAAVLLDGLPLTIGWDHRSDPSLLPTSGIERITLVRGLSSLLGGPNTLGGLISLDLNAPLPRDGTLPRGTLSFGTGIDQYGARVVNGAGTAPVRVGNGTLRVRGGVAYRQRDGFALSRDGASGSGTVGGAADPGSVRDADLRTNTDLRQLDGFAGLRYDMKGGAYVGLTATAYDAERGVAPEQHLAAPRFWRYPAASRQLAIVSVGSGVRSTPFGAGSLEVSAGVNRGEVTIESFFDVDYDSLTARELGDEGASTIRAVATHTLPGSSTLRVGGTLGTVRYDETLDAQRATSVARRYEQRLSSTGVELEVPVMSRVLVSGGIVRDAASTPDAGGRTPIEGQSLLGWRAGTTFAVNDALRLHASASRRARFPALRELYSGALDRFDPNPDLEPEQLLGYEGGVTYSANAGASAFQLQGVAFHHDLDDAVVRITLPDRKFRRINRDEIRTTGGEFLLAWTPSAAAGVSFNADLLAQRVRIHDRTLAAGASNERRAEHQPELRGSLNVSAPLLYGTRVSAAGRYTGRQFCQHPDLGRQVELGAQTVADAAVSRSWSVRRAGLFQWLRAVLAMDNISDATVYDQCGLPQQGRTLRMGVELR